MHSQINIGSSVKLVVPFGPKAGLVVGYGKVKDYLISDMDGTTFFVKESNGKLNEYAESWVKLV